MANIREVAKKAGVGVGTVSRMLNNTGYVSEETRRKITEAIREMEYVPAKPKTKNGRKTSLIGIMIPDIEHPFFARMMRCLDEELTRFGYKSVLCNTINIVNRQVEMIEMLESYALDGLIACGDPPPGFQGRKGRPIVSLDRFWHEEVPIVRSDHQMGGSLAAEVFLKGGCHRIIQFLGGSDYADSANQRHKTVEKILKENGCDVVSVFMQWDALSYSYNKRIVEKYWEVIRKADGCFTNDIGALSCLSVAQKMGLRVPEDFKIIACDGTELTRVITPELTTLQQDCQALAKKSVQLIMEMMRGEEPQQTIYEVPIRLLERGTT
ncbi:MAG: LacI family DNA-binding transcriptional regulator [Marvinbryantia sp.]